MPKVMIFIDGTWLYYNNDELGKPDKDYFELDYGRLPSALAEEVRKQLDAPEVDVIRTYLFGSYPDNYDSQDDKIGRRQRDFFSSLKEKYHYEVETFPIDFRGKRYKKIDRDPGDEFEPKEKCVDISLATTMLYLAAVPNVYDIAIAVIGDRDFLPVLQRVRDLGRRVAIASIKDHCAQEFHNPRDEARVKDFDIIWLDELLDKLEAITSTKKRKNIEKLKESSGTVSYEVEVGRTYSGMVVRKIEDEGRGYIDIPGLTEDLHFFRSDLRDIDFDILEEGDLITFEVKELAAGYHRASVMNVRRFKEIEPDLEEEKPSISSQPIVQKSAESEILDSLGIQQLLNEINRGVLKGGGSIYQTDSELRLVGPVPNRIQHCDISIRVTDNHTLSINGKECSATLDHVKVGLRGYINALMSH